MYVPLDSATAARAAVVLATSRPWRLVELGLVDLPDAAGTRQEGQRDRTANLQQFGRSDLRHPGRTAASAAETGRCDTTTMQCRLRLDVEPPCREAARAIDVQLKTVPGDVAYRLEWQCAEHSGDGNPAARPESLCQQ
jgi:hypothetical protein